MSQTLTYEVPDVSCQHCRAAIEGEVSGLAGVEEIDVDLDAKRVTVTGDELDDGAIRAAIDAAGFEIA